MEAAPKAASSLRGMGDGAGGRKLNTRPSKRFPERCVKLHVVPKLLLLKRPQRMEPCTEYRIKAAELFELANSDHYSGLKLQCDHVRDANHKERGSKARLSCPVLRPEGNAPRVLKGLGVGEPR